jgi:hypothetical protein
MTWTARLALAALVALPVSCGPSVRDEAGGPDAGGGSGGPWGNGSGKGSCEEAISLRVDVTVQAPDLLLVLDRSASMGEPLQPSGFTRKWDIIIDAVDETANTMADQLQMGLMLVPDREQVCQPGVIDVAPAKNSSKTVANYLADPFLVGGSSSPLAKSLDNARAHYGSAPVNPFGRYVFFVTDGLPNCPAEPDGDAAAEARTAIRRLRDQGIRTYVLGIAADSGIATVLNSFAAAGGTGTHFGASSSAELMGAFEQLSSEVSEVSCEYQLENGPLYDYDLNVSVGGEPVPMDPENGWSYDTATRWLTFHGEACEGLRTGGDRTINASYCDVVD